jgi:hypothetical protein
LQTVRPWGYIKGYIAIRVCLVPPQQMPLTDVIVRNAKPAAKPQKLFDGGGLFLLVHPNGSKYWRWKYRFLGKEKLLAAGVYPDVPLRQARAAGRVAHAARVRR